MTHTQTFTHPSIQTVVHLRGADALRSAPFADDVS